MKREVRFAKSLEVRQQPGRPPLIRGYAATFNTLSRPMALDTRGNSFVERIVPGAFSKAIAQGDVRALVDHDASKIIGRTKSGTLMLREDSKGLFCEIRPPDTGAGRDVVESVKRGDLDSMSFGFYATNDDWGTTANGQTLRELREVELLDVSIVTYPAYPSTSVAVRSLFPDGIPPNVAKRMGQTPDHAAALNPDRSWMSENLQRFYRHQDLKAKLNKREDEFERSVLARFPDSNLARKLKIERELEEIEQDMALDDNRAMKSRLHERWARKDPYAVWPLWRDPELYAKKTPGKRREKDPWAAYRLL